MDEDLSKYKDLIQRMEATPKVPVPDHFTETVMSRLPEMQHSFWLRARDAFLNPVKGVLNVDWAQKFHVANKWECSFYFFITGFFYLIMGMMLMAAFKGITSNISTTEWIRLQPQLALGTAVWFIALGTLLMVDGRTAMKLARYGTLFYIFFTVVNGMLMQPYVHIPYAGIFIVGFVATGVLMGVILAIAVQKMELKPA